MASWVGSLPAVVMKFVVFLATGTGVALSLGIIDGAFAPESLSFFTVLASALAAVYYLVDGIWMARHRDAARRGGEWCVKLKHIVLLAVLITGIIANTLLVGVNVPTKLSDAISADLLHLAAPVLVLLDWLLFERHGRIKAAEPVLWLAFPTAYLAYIMVAVGVFGLNANSMDAATNYPYPFLDVALSGVPTVAMTVGGLYAAFLVFGYALFGIDRLLGKLARRSD